MTAERNDEGKARGAGDASAERLLELLYDELRALARAQLAREAPGHSLPPTALVHEAYLRMVSPQGSPEDWKNRSYFFAAAARAMHRILIDHARKKHATKRGGDWRRIELTDLPIACDLAAFSSDDQIDLEALRTAIDRLEKIDPRAANIAMLRGFVGLSIDESAEILGVSRATAVRELRFARAWIVSEIER